MTLQISKSEETQYNPVFKNIHEDVPGGGTLKVADLKTATTEIGAGAIVGEDGSTARLYHLIKTAIVQATLSAGGTSLRVTKAHEFKAGEFITNGQVSTAIVSITTTETAYDTIVLTAALDPAENIAAGTVLYQGSAETTNAATASTATVEDIVDATLTVSNPRGKNGVKIVIAQAGGDTLAVTFAASTRTLTISLANTTPGKNTAALIQAAIRALVIDGEDVFTDWTCAAGGTWDAAAVGGVLTVASDYMGGGVEKPAQLDPIYDATGVLKNTTDVSGDSPNAGISIVNRGTVNESILPFGVTDLIKTQLSDRIVWA
ncbi:MAG TPA: hypothetical protein VMW32_05730 [Bacteroidales bacterium]|nr:hypothetical protein [Bacteroidales bacterium]